LLNKAFAIESGCPRQYFLIDHLDPFCRSLLMFSSIDRRRLLLGAIAASGLRSPPAWAAETNPAACTWPPPDWVENKSFPSRRWVKIVFVHTGEHFNKLYMEDGSYIMPAVQQFSWTCRDFRENAWQWLNPYLMDFLFVLHWKYCRDEISIMSGYRTPETNSKLEGAALNSQHLRANALDIHLPNVDNAEVAKDFKTFIYGGVGMYPLKHFTHLDCGPLRNWVG
jgi:uncharacterized protein YcbK (DUF882 family)